MAYILNIYLKFLQRGLLPEKANLPQGSDAKPTDPILAHSLDWGVDTMSISYERRALSY